jgi:hypothetical protein
MGQEPDMFTVDAITNYWLTTFAGLPVTVAVNGYANWRAKDDYHHVALVEFKEYPDLSFSKNWHITLESSRQPIPAYTFDTESDAFRYDICDRLWLGYKDVFGQKKFIDAEKAHTLVRELA